MDGRVVAATTLTISPRLRGGERLAEIRARLAEFLAPWGKARAAAIEGPSLESTHREYDLGEGSGAIRSWVFEHARVEMVVVPPSSLKKYAAGSGSAGKEDMVRYAVRDYGLALREDEDDAADAAHLAHLAYSLAWPSRPRTRHAAEVLRDLRTPAAPKRRARPFHNPNNV